MKKILMIGAAVASALAVPAGAQTVTGTINITGSVTPRCAAIVGGAESTTFTDTVALGELAQANGTLKASGDLEAAFQGTGGGAPSFRVICNSTSPAVTVTANPLVNAAPAGAGFSNRVDYTARVAFNTTGGAVNVADSSLVAASTGQSLGSPLTGVGNNVTVTADTFTTAPGAQMVAGNYSGNIIVTVTPS